MRREKEGERVGRERGAGRERGWSEERGGRESGEREEQ